MDAKYIACIAAALALGDLAVYQILMPYINVASIVFLIISVDALISSIPIASELVDHFHKEKVEEEVENQKEYRKNTSNK